MYTYTYILTQSFWTGTKVIRRKHIVQPTGFSEITTLAFINMDPSDCSTIYTALCYARAQCDKAGQKTCFVTFDQPLYIKATEIVRSSHELACVVVRLGGFHLLMSLMGAIGYIMSGSGLQELWESVYAKNSVVHMISGHTCNRALWAHFLTQQALASILFKSSDVLDGTEVAHLCKLYEDVLHGEHCIADAVEDPAVVTLDQRMKDMLGNIATLDKKWFEISSGRSEQVTGPCIWTPLERCCHSSMHRATFIMQNQHICTTRRCAACMMSWTWMNSRLTQRKASSPSGAATGSGAVSGLIWPGVDACNEGFWRAHTRARNNREHSG